MKKLVIFGIGKIAEVAFFYFTQDSDYEVCGFTVDKEYMQATEFSGLPVVPYEKLEKTFPPESYELFIPIGYKNMNRNRADKFLEAKQRGYKMATYISSKALYYGTPVGENCFILENNVIQPYTEIEDDVIMWSGNHLGHHSVIKSHCFITSQVVISGGSIIGEHSFLGVNSTVRDNIVIGRANLIGAGAVILKSTEDKAVYTVPKSIKLEKTSEQIENI